MLKFTLFYGIKETSLMNDRKAHIAGMGTYLPERVLSNHDLEKMVDTSDEWILSRTGISERRLAHSEEFTSDMGYEAAKKALAQADADPKDVELILVATMTPDYPSPSTAALIQSRLGIPCAAAMDVQAACTGFLYILSIAKSFIESGMHKNILIVASEKMSSFIDYNDRNTCVLFGDGAAAAFITSEKKGLSVDNIQLGADGKLAELIIIPGGGSRSPASETSFQDGSHFFKMAGKEVFKHAVRRMASAAQTCLDDVGLKQEDISWLIPHQANVRIIDAIAKYFVIPPEKVYKTLHKYGNTSASSLPIALSELLQEKSIQDGERLLLVAFGGGLTWGASLLTMNTNQGAPTNDNKT